MALSTHPRQPARGNITSVYGLDPETWRAFRAWCISNGVPTARELNAALLAHMRADRPAAPPPDSEDDETGQNA